MADLLSRSHIYANLNYNISEKNQSHQNHRCQKIDQILKMFNEFKIFKTKNDTTNSEEYKINLKKKIINIHEILGHVSYGKFIKTLKGFNFDKTEKRIIKKFIKYV
ncbi:hypothetical protein GVAV_001773 [Gurleya vavrai]